MLNIIYILTFFKAHRHLDDCLCRRHIFPHTDPDTFAICRHQCWQSQIDEIKVLVSLKAKILVLINLRFKIWLRNKKNVIFFPFSERMQAYVTDWKILFTSLILRKLLTFCLLSWFQLDLEYFLWFTGPTDFMFSMKR